ncbi:MAG TPA: hypothetical protein PK014_01910 [Thermoanaerobaculia bacterium]|mgnify:CR=1 FL=1|nr:hypothetical protein [Thermoanaerobaculia bacterium]HUM28552.1 hypothetical protein [Thermoanaerobaculia bacterium]HXK66840.1 hypothetical protein [Thermoanaerobaculia bacterium]
MKHLIQVRITGNRVPIALAVLLFLSGCSSLQVESVRESLDTGGKLSHVLVDASFPSLKDRVSAEQALLREMREESLEATSLTTWLKEEALTPENFSRVIENQDIDGILVVSEGEIRTILDAHPDLVTEEDRDKTLHVAICNPLDFDGRYMTPRPEKFEAEGGNEVELVTLYYLLLDARTGQVVWRARAISQGRPDGRGAVARDQSRGIIRKLKEDGILSR